MSPAGDPERVAARLRAWQAPGIETFGLSGHWRREEPIRFPERGFPLLGKDRLTLLDTRRTGGTFDIRVTRRRAGASRSRVVARRARG